MTARAGRDLMFQDEIRELVVGAYEELAEPDGPATVLYDPADLEGLPDGARRWALGVGAPVAHATSAPAKLWSTSAAAPASTRCWRPGRSHPAAG